MTGTDWERVRQELRDAGFPGFEFDAGEAAVPGLSGEWVIGEVERDGRLRRGAQSRWVRLLDALPGGSAVTADPTAVPEGIRDVADRNGLSAVMVIVAFASLRSHDRTTGCDRMSNQLQTLL